MILEQACKHKRHFRSQYTRNISKFSHILSLPGQIYEKFSRFAQPETSQPDLETVLGKRFNMS